MRTVRRTLYLTIFALVMGLPQLQAAKLTKLNSREYKILLKPELFVNRQEAYKKVWEIAKSLADSLGIEVRESRQPFREQRRKVYFLDTPDHDLRKHGYVLRVRVKYNGNKPRKEYNLTLKYRSTDLQKSAQADITVALKGYKTKAKFEADITPIKDSLGTMRFIYSKSVKVKKLDFSPGNTIGDYAKIFPVLGKLGVPLDKKLEIVNGFIVDERKVSPGMFVFGGGINGMVDITTWYEFGDTSSPFVAEFSYDFRFMRHNEMIDKGIERASEFFKALQFALKDWYYPEGTKTGYVYSHKPTVKKATIKKGGTNVHGVQKD